MSERWTGNYSPQVFLNFASFLISDILPAQLGDRWTRFEHKHSQDILSLQSKSPQGERDEAKNLKSLTGTFLSMFTPDQADVSFAIVKEAVRATGDFAYTDLSNRLADIRGRLPTGSEQRRTREEIEAEMKRLDEIKPTDKGWRDARKKHTALFKELMALYHDTGANDARALNDEILQSLKKIRCAVDLQALQDWACSREPGFQWALQNLKSKDKKRYVASLEWWMKNTEEEWVRQAFHAIAKEDSERATEIAKGIPPGKKGDLTVSAFSHLAEVDGIPDEEKRVKALIRVALDPKSGWQERGRAIDLLVPPDQPLRYPSRNVDDAMVKLLGPRYADEVLNSTLASASRALARRGRTEYFDKIAAALETAGNEMVYSEVLGSLVHMSQYDAAGCNPRLQDILRPQMKHTNKMMTDLLMAIWAADLRDLKPDLESLATSGPEDYEDEKARTCGGEVCDVEGRFHLARKILSLWNEEDLPTRCRLLLALGFHGAYDFVQEPVPERLARMKGELTKAAQSLAVEQRKEVAAFLDWYQSEHINQEAESAYRDRRVKFDLLVRDALDLK